MMEFVLGSGVLFKEDMRLGVWGHEAGGVWVGRR